MNAAKVAGDIVMFLSIGGELRGLAEWGKSQNDVAEVFDDVVHIDHFGSV